MIHDSVPWREDLARVAKRLRERAVQQRWTERTSYLVERDLITGMFAIRRLIESGKCSSRLPKQRVSVQICKMSGRDPDLLDRWTPWEHYDLENARPSELDVWSLAQQFIHSFIFMLDFDERDGNFSGVYVGSDKTKKSHLYRVGISAVVELFEFVASEDVVHAAQYRLNGVSERFTISQHDLVKAGLAAYVGGSNEFVRHFKSLGDEEVRRAFPELEDFLPVRFRPPSWSDASGGPPETH